MELDWDNFLWPYNEAVRELKVKFRSLRQGFLTKGEHSPIEFVIGRVKTVDSIKEKMKRRVISPDVIETDMQDIAGIRIVTQFVDDIYKVVETYFLDLGRRKEINELLGITEPCEEMRATEESFS